MYIFVNVNVNTYKKGAMPQPTHFSSICMKMCKQISHHQYPHDFYPFSCEIENCGTKVIN